MSSVDEYSGYATESSHSPEHVWQSMLPSENEELSIGLQTQETDQTLGELVENPFDSAASDNISEESVCSKCGGTKLSSRTDLESLPAVQQICKCGSESNETQEEETTNLKSIKNLENENQLLPETGESSTKKLPSHELADSGEVLKAVGENVTSGLVPGNIIVSVDVESKPLSTEPDQQIIGSKLDEATDDETTLLQPHTEASVEEIVEMEEGLEGRQSPGVTSASSTRALMANYPSHIRCREDSDSLETNRPSYLDENLPLILLACLILCPLLIVVSIALAYQLWLDSKINSTGNLDRNSTADE